SHSRSRDGAHRMSDPRRDAVIAAIGARYPSARIEVRPNRAPETAADIPDCVMVLDMEAGRELEVHEFALDVAFAVYGDALVPFHVCVVDAEQSDRYYPRAAAAAPATGS